MAQTSSPLVVDFYHQTLANALFISRHGADITIVTARDPISGNLRATVTRTEGHGRRKERTALFSDVGTTLHEVYALLHTKSAEAVHNHVTTLGYDLVPIKHKGSKRKKQASPKEWDDGQSSSGDDSASSCSESDGDEDDEAVKADDMSDASQFTVHLSETSLSDDETVSVVTGKTGKDSKRRQSRKRTGDSSSHNNMPSLLGYEPAASGPRYVPDGVAPARRGAMGKPGPAGMAPPAMAAWPSSSRPVPPPPPPPGFPGSKLAGQAAPPGRGPNSSVAMGLNHMPSFIGVGPAAPRSIPPPPPSLGNMGRTSYTVPFVSGPAPPVVSPATVSASECCATADAAAPAAPKLPSTFPSPPGTRPTAASMPASINSPLLTSTSSSSEARVAPKAAGTELDVIISVVWAQHFGRARILARCAPSKEAIGLTAIRYVAAHPETFGPMPPPGAVPFGGVPSHRHPLVYTVKQVVLPSEPPLPGDRSTRQTYDLRAYMHDDLSPLLCSSSSVRSGPDMPIFEVIVTGWARLHHTTMAPPPPPPPVRSRRKSTESEFASDTESIVDDE